MFKINSIESFDYKNITLYTSVYNDKNKDRQKELMQCLVNNVNSNINKIVLFKEKKDILEKNNIFNHIKILIVDIDKRPTFKSVFDYINNQNPSINDISIVANSDIYFDNENIEKLKKYNLTNRVLALTRWDIQDNNSSLFMNREDSQDTWIFNGKIKNLNYSDFHFGILGCDNRIAYELKESGYEVLNIGKDLKTYHLHLSNIRNYSNDRIPIPYLSLPFVSDNILIDLNENI